MTKLAIHPPHTTHLSLPPTAVEELWRRAWQLQREGQIEAHNAHVAILDSCGPTTVIRGKATVQEAACGRSAVAV
jgi:hypothetical protein